MAAALAAPVERVKIARAAEITGETRRTLQALAAAGRIPGAVKERGQWIFDESALRRWLESGKPAKSMYLVDEVWRLVRDVVERHQQCSPSAEMLTAADGAAIFGIDTPGFLELVRRDLLPIPEADGLWLQERLEIRWATLRRSRRVRGSIYVVGFDDYVKIGFTAAERLVGRLSTLQTGAPRRLEIFGNFLGNKLDETMLHCMFFNYRTSGEWYLRRGELRRWISEGCTRP